MKLIIDTTERTFTREDQENTEVYELFSAEAFELLSQQWLRIGWNQKYTYTFSWMGRPVIQLPEDMIRIQEVIHRVKPDVVVETGIAHGGSLIYYASLCKVMGNGRVIGVDIEIRPHNRKAIETHILSPYITLIEGDSTEPDVIADVRSHLRDEETVMVILDSNHAKEHVLRELEAYSKIVTPGSYIVATDGIMGTLPDVPRGNPNWTWNNPAAAAKEFLERHSEFIEEQPPWPFNESLLTKNITHWPGAWLRRHK